MSNVDMQKEKWNMIKSKGKKNYILIHGVLTFAIISILMATFNIFVLNRTLSYSIKHIIVIYFGYLISWSLLGILFSTIFWENNIKKFGK